MALHKMSPIFEMFRKSKTAKTQWFAATVEIIGLDNLAFQFFDKSKFDNKFDK